MDAEGIVLTFVGINEPGDVEGWLQAAAPPGTGPRADPACCPGFNGEMGNPALLRPSRLLSSVETDYLR